MDLLLDTIKIFLGQEVVAKPVVGCLGVAGKRVKGYPFLGVPGKRV